MKPAIKSQLRSASYLLTTFTFVWFLFQLLHFNSGIDNRHAQLQVKLSELGETLTSKISHEIQSQKRVLNTLQKKISAQTKYSQHSEELILEALTINPDLESVGLCFAPNSYQANVRLYAPRAQRSSEGNALQRIDFQYDYTSPAYTLYHRTITQDMTWSPVHRDPVSRKRVIQLSQTFAQPKLQDGAENGIEQPKDGYCYFQIGLNRFSEIINELDLPEDTYVFLVSDDNKIISHPLDSYSDSFASVGEAFQEQLHFKDLVPGSFISSTENHNGRSVIIYSQEIPEVRWKVGITSHKAHEILENPFFFQKYIKLQTGAILLVFFLGFAVLLSIKKNRIRFAWIFAGTLTFFFTSGIIIMWFISHHSVRHLSNNNHSESVTFLEKSDLKKFKASQVRENYLSRGKIPVFIPTGIFIQGLEFSKDGDLKIVGHAWQKILKSLKKNVQPGIVFPGAIRRPQLTKTHVEDLGDYLLHNWHFDVVLRDSFKIKKYPFDHKNIALRLWPMNHDQNVVLIPDMDAYDIMNPHDLPGIENKIVAPDWAFESSYFRTEKNSLGTNFGTSASYNSSFAELHFEFVMQRYFWGPFVSNIIPISVAMVIIFFTILGMTRQEGQSKYLGFTVGGNMEIVAALFFGTLFSHFNLRASLPVQDLFYLELFYFALYITLLFASMNHFLFAWNKKIFSLEWGYSHAAKILYWPALNGVLYLATAITFY